MAGPIAIDTPDYQRGVVSAQKLVGVIPAGLTTVTVGVPPNAESLVVAMNQSDSSLFIDAHGVTTGYNYPGAQLWLTVTAEGGSGWVFDTSAQVDEQVEINLSSAATDPMYVYADAGVHVVADMSKRMNMAGQQYVIPSLPSVLSGDHPFTELSLISPTLAANGTVLAAPGAGQRYRVFSAQMSAATAGLSGGLVDNVGAKVLLFCAGVGNSVTSIPAQGYPMAANSPLTYSLATGAGGMQITVYYTTETI